MNYIREAELYLKDYEHLKKSLSNLKMDIIELNSKLKSVKEINISDMPHGSATINPDDAIVNQLFILKCKKEMYSETLKKVNKIERVLKELPAEDANILRLWYLEGFRCEQLMKDMNCSESTIFRIKSKAIRTLAIQLFGIKVIT